MRTRSLGLALAPWLLLACNGTVLIDGTTTTPGTGGTGTTTVCEGCGGYTTGGGGPGGGGGAGAEGGWGGSGGSPACSQAHATFDFRLAELKSGQAYDCSTAPPGGGPGNVGTHLEGVVIETSSTGLFFDACAPNADCQGTRVYQLDVQSEGFWVAIPVGAFVQVDTQMEFSWGCTARLLVRNLPVFGGMPSPLGDTAQLLFAGAEGTLAAIAGAPFTVDKYPLGCGGQPTGCGTPESYALVVQAASATQATVQQSDALPFTAVDAGVQRELLFRNLRSYESGWCDDGGNYAYWVTPALYYE